MSTNLLNVVVGLLFNAEGHILIARRPPQVVSPGFWEFPGGKVEVGETLEAALTREFFEEIGIEIAEIAFFLTITKDMPDKKLCLNVFNIRYFSGIPRGCENQEICFVPISELENYQFLPANREIIERLRGGGVTVTTHPML